MTSTIKRAAAEQSVLGYTGPIQSYGSAIEKQQEMRRGTYNFYCTSDPMNVTEIINQ